MRLLPLQAFIESDSGGTQTPSSQSPYGDLQTGTPKIGKPPGQGTSSSQPQTVLTVSERG